MSERAAWVAASVQLPPLPCRRGEAVAWAAARPPVTLRIVEVEQAIAAGEAWHKRFVRAGLAEGRRVVKLCDADDVDAPVGRVIRHLDEAVAVVDWGDCPGYPAGVCIEYLDELLPVGRA